MAAAALQHGDIFAGRYRIVRELASGGMGAVYEVIHTVTERRCALKVMLSHTVEREQLRKRFMQESRLAAQIGSEYIVDVLDAGVDDETKAPYLVMELLEGEDLGQRLLRLGPLSREETVSYLWHVALALDRTHQSGIVHRDLKASNLFLTRREDGSALVKVLDFGVAKVLSFERSGEQRTQTVGTPIYMAPEQFRAEGRISPATDIYALGMLSYTLLVGVHYWMSEHERCDNPFAFASIAVHGPKEAPSIRAGAHGVMLPQTFDDWFFKATSRWPQDRFPSATAMIGELSRVLGVEVPSAVSLTITGTGSGTGPISSTGTPIDRILPATIESPSARLTGAGLANPTGATAEDSGVELTREQHTEHSLSVTSGGLPFKLPEPAPRRFPVGAAVAALVLAAVVVVVAVVRSWDSSAVVEAHKEPAAAAAQPTAPATSSRTAVPVEKPRDVTRIEELPLAPPEPNHTVSGVEPAGTVKGTRPKAAPPPLPRTRPGVTPAPVTGAQPATPASKPFDRESLYRRD